MKKIKGLSSTTDKFEMNDNVYRKIVIFLLPTNCLINQFVSIIEVIKEKLKEMRKKTSEEA